MLRLEDLIMDLRAAVIIALCISCASASKHEASASKHEKQKWIKWMEEQVEDCETPEKGKYPVKIGSVPGTPGVDYPNFLEIPNTKFTCAAQNYVPGFYADLDTNCQVFHVCYENRRESFLCPVGTIFSQPILACDYWYSANCSIAPKYYKGKLPKPTDIQIGSLDPIIEELITEIVEKEISEKFRPDEHYKGKPSKTLKHKTTPKASKTEESLKQYHKQIAYPVQLQDSSDEVFGYVPNKDKLVPPFESPKKTDESMQSDELLSFLKGDAQVAASMILKSLLPIKSKVISLVAEEARKEKPAKLDSNKPVKAEPVKAIPTESSLKPNVPQTIFLSVPKVKPVPKAKLQIPMKPAVPLKVANLKYVPAAKKVSSFQPKKFPAKASSPISLLTQKKLAHNYAKLLKLKKLKSPLLGLKNFL